MNREDITEEDYENFFDRLNLGMDYEGADRQNKESEAQGKKLDYLIHYIFSQNDKGEELLEIWKDSLMMVPTVEPGIDKFEAGMREGYKRMIRTILLTIAKVERGD